MIPLISDRDTQKQTVECQVVARGWGERKYGVGHDENFKILDSI